MVRLLILPVRLLLFPFRVAAGSARAGYRAGRTVGISRSLFFGVGFASGVLVASPRARRVALAGARRASVAVAKARTEPPAPDPTDVPDLVVAAPHGVVLADPAVVEADGPSGPVLPTD